MALFRRLTPDFGFAPARALAVDWSAPLPGTGTAASGSVIGFS